MGEPNNNAISQQINIEDTPLSLRVKNGLLRNGVRTLYDLFNCSEYKILHFKNIGKGSLDELNEFIEKCKTDKIYWAKLLKTNNIETNDDIYSEFDNIQANDKTNEISSENISEPLNIENVENEPIIINSNTKLDDIPEFFFESVNVIEGLSEKAITKLKDNKIRKIGQLVQNNPEQLFLSAEDMEKIVYSAINNDSCEIPDNLNFDNDIKIINKYFWSKGIQQYPIKLSVNVNLAITEYTIDEIIQLGWLEILIDIIEKGFPVLSEIQREVILKRFGINCPKMTLEELGQDCGGKTRTRERIRQIEKGALEKIEKYLIKNGYFSFINKTTCQLFSDIGTIYKIKDTDKLKMYYPLISKFEDKFLFLIDEDYWYVVKDPNWFSIIKDSIENIAEKRNNSILTKESLVDILKEQLSIFNSNEDSLQIENYNDVLNDLIKEYTEHYLIKVDNNNYRLLQNSKRSRSGKVKTDERNEEIIALFAKTYPEGVHLPIDKNNVLEDNLKDLIDQIPYEMSIRTLSDGIIKSAKEIILWDLGFYKHIDTIHIQWSAVDEAISRILAEFDNGNTNFSIKKIFENDSQYFINAGIPNYTALLGLIKYQDNPRIGNKKLEIFDVYSEGDNINKTEIIEQYLLEVDNWVSVKDMYKHFCDEMGWEEYQIEQYVSNSNNAKKDTNLGFIHIKTLRRFLDKDALKDLLHQLYIQLNYTESIKINDFKRYLFRHKWKNVLGFDVTGNFMSDFIDSLNLIKLPMIFHQGYVYNKTFESLDKIGEYVIKNHVKRDHSKIYDKFKDYSRNIDDLIDSQIKLSTILNGKEFEEFSDFLYKQNIQNLGEILFFPFDDLQIKKKFKPSILKKTIDKVNSWLDSINKSDDSSKKLDTSDVLGAGW